MAISPQCFAPRKRRPSAAAFVFPKLSNAKLVKTLLSLTHEISSLKPLQCLLKQNSTSIIRKVKLLSILFQEILRNNTDISASKSALLCLEEMYIVLQRIKALIEDCSTESKMWLLMQIELAANTFHELNLDLATLLDVFPANELELNDDVREIVVLIRNQCSKSKPVVSPKDESLRRQVATMLRRIRLEITPDHSKLLEIFLNLELSSSKFCTEEIESLQDEIQNQNDDEVVALIGLVRYAKCVLFGTENVARGERYRRLDSAAEASIPADFRCPVTLELMRDPVVVATGQTYDRESITSWIASRHATCPKTGQTLAHTRLTPNHALRNLIAMWCRQQRIPFETVGIHVGNRGVVSYKAAFEATRMTVLFLVNKLSSYASSSLEAANSVVYELRVLAKTDSDSRVCIAQAGALPVLVRYMSLDVGSKLPNLQVNAVTTMLNLSILDANKTKIMETDGVLNGVIEVLRLGATWEAKANAAATIFSLSSVTWYRKRLGRKTRMVKGLIDLARDGPSWSKRDPLMAILNLAIDRDTVGRLVEYGIIEMINEAQTFDEFSEETVIILELVIKRGGLVAVIAAFGTIRKLGALLRDGTDKVKESCAATLVTMCRHGGSEMVVELATLPGIERTIWELSGRGTSRARRKATSLLRILRRWAAGLDSNSEIDSSNVTSTSTIVTTSRTILLI